MAEAKNQFGLQLKGTQYECTSKVKKEYEAHMAKMREVMLGEYLKKELGLKESSEIQLKEKFDEIEKGKAEHKNELVKVN